MLHQFTGILALGLGDAAVSFLWCRNLSAELK